MTYQTTNDFDLTRQDGTYTGATGELVVSDGGTITLPAPTAGEKFGVRALRNDVTLLANGSTEGSTSDRRITSEGNSVFVSDGTEWYLVSGNEYFGFDIPDSGLAHRYEFEDDSDPTTAIDSEASANGSITGASYVTTAQVGSLALSGDGSDDTVTIDTGDTTAPLTFTLWAEKDSTTSGKRLMDQGDGRFAISYEQQQSQGMEAEIYDGSTAYQITSGHDPTAGYEMYTLRIDSNGNAEFFVGDASQGTASTGGIGQSSTGQSILSSSGGGDNWDGDSDDAKIYTKALSDQEISDLYAAQS